MRRAATALLAALPAAAAARVAADALDVRANFPLALALSTLAGLSTGLGGALGVLQPDLTPRHLGLCQAAAAGFMLSVSLADLLPAALADLAAARVAACVALGAALFRLLKACLPAPAPPAAKHHDAAAGRALASGLLTAAGLALHNLPEGAAVCVAALRGARFGAPLALAIGLHNVPEGLAVAVPLYYATRDRAYAVRVATLSGLAEPAGVVLVLAVIAFTGAVTREAVAASTAAVAGVMVLLCADELLPQAVAHAGPVDATLAAVVGFAAMAAVLAAAEWLTGGGL